LVFGASEDGRDDVSNTVEIVSYDTNKKVDVETYMKTTRQIS
jgi:hypothetical protein